MQTYNTKLSCTIVKLPVFVLQCTILLEASARGGEKVFFLYLLLISLHVFNIKCTGTHWVAEICHLIHNNGDLDKVDRQQQPMPLEFDANPSENRVARYKLAPGWESPRVLVTHVPKRFLPDQVLSQNKGKVMCGNERMQGAGS